MGHGKAGGSVFPSIPWQSQGGLPKSRAWAWLWGASRLESWPVWQWKGRWLGHRRGRSADCSQVFQAAAGAAGRFPGSTSGWVGLLKLLQCLENRWVEVLRPSPHWGLSPLVSSSACVRLFKGEACPVTFAVPSLVLLCKMVRSQWIVVHKMRKEVGLVAGIWDLSGLSLCGHRGIFLGDERGLHIDPPSVCHYLCCWLRPACRSSGFQLCISGSAGSWRSPAQPSLSLGGRGGQACMCPQAFEMNPMCSQI